MKMFVDLSMFQKYSRVRKLAEKKSGGFTRTLVGIPDEKVCYLFVKRGS